MDYACILLMILGILTSLFGIYISKGNGKLLKPYGVKKDMGEIKKAGNVAAIVGIVIFVIFLIDFLIKL